MSLVAKKALPEQIFALLRDRIIAGDMPGDAAIRQDALATEIGVSKIPLREALARLEQDGLIYSETNRGFFVRRLSLAEADDVFSLRLRIEPDAAADASLLARPGHIEAARQALAALDEAVEQHRVEAGALNRAFHMGLIRPADRPITEQTVERLQVLAERYVVKHLEPAGRQPRAHAEHHRLLAAWENGQADLVRQLSADHIRDTFADLRTALIREAELMNGLATSGS